MMLKTAERESKRKGETEENVATQRFTTNHNV